MKVLLSLIVIIILPVTSWGAVDMSSGSYNMSFEMGPTAGAIDEVDWGQATYQWTYKTTEHTGTYSAGAPISTTSDDTRRLFAHIDFSPCTDVSLCFWRKSYATRPAGDSIMRVLGSVNSTTGTDGDWFTLKDWFDWATSTAWTQETSFSNLTSFSGEANSWIKLQPKKVTTGTTLYIDDFFLSCITESAPSMEVVINEVAWMGTTGSTYDEWFELYNPTSSSVEMVNWTLLSTDGGINITVQGLLGAKGFWLLERTDDNAVANVICDQTYSGAMGNDGENLELRDGNNVLIDTVDCSTGWFAGDNLTKQTLERKDPTALGNSADNWCSCSSSVAYAYEDVNGGTDSRGSPRAENSCYVGEESQIVISISNWRELYGS